jgi:hypothetical protein
MEFDNFTIDSTDHNYIKTFLMVMPKHLKVNETCLSISQDQNTTQVLRKIIRFRYRLATTAFVTGIVHLQETVPMAPRQL